MSTEVLVAIIAIVPTTLTAVGVLWLRIENTKQHGRGQEAVANLQADMLEVKADVRDVKADIREIKRMVNPWDFHGQDPRVSKLPPQ